MILVLDKQIIRVHVHSKHGNKGSHEYWCVDRVTRTSPLHAQLPVARLAKHVDVLACGRPACARCVTDCPGRLDSPAAFVQHFERRGLLVDNQRGGLPVSPEPTAARTHIHRTMTCCTTLTRLARCPSSHVARFLRRHRCYRAARHGLQSS